MFFRDWRVKAMLIQAQKSLASTVYDRKLLESAMVLQRFGKRVIRRTGLAGNCRGRSVTRDLRLQLQCFQPSVQAPYNAHQGLCKHVL